MKRILLALGLAASTALAAQVPAYAQPTAPVTLGLPATGGTGCPQGTVSAVLSPDMTTLSILFDAFVVEAGGSTGRTFERKSCNVAIPVNVPNGISISIVTVDYRGFNALPPGGRSIFDVEYFFAGSQGPRFQRTFNGPLVDNYMIRNELLATAIVWSQCGDDPILRTNANLSVFTNTTGPMPRQQALATVDSEDVSVALLFHLRFRQC